MVDWFWMNNTSISHFEAVLTTTTTNYSYSNLQVVLHPEEYLDVSKLLILPDGKPLPLSLSRISLLRSGRDSLSVSRPSSWGKEWNRKNKRKQSEKQDTMQTAGKNKITKNITASSGPIACNERVGQKRENSKILQNKFLYIRKERNIPGIGFLVPIGPVFWCRRRGGRKQSS